MWQERVVGKKSVSLKIYSWRGRTEIGKNEVRKFIGSWEAQLKLKKLMKVCKVEGTLQLQ